MKKRGGGTRLQRVQVLKSGKFKFVKNLKGSKSAAKISKSKKKTKSNLKGKRKRMVNRKIPLAILIGLGVGLEEPVRKLVSGNSKGAIDDLSFRYIGFNRNTRKMDLQGLKQGLVPLIIGAMVSKFVGGRPLNLNQRLRDIPFIKI